MVGIHSKTMLSHSEFVAHNIIMTSNIHYCDTRVLLAMDRRYMESLYIQQLKLDSSHNNALNYGAWDVGENGEENEGLAGTEF